MEIKELAHTAREAVCDDSSGACASRSTSGARGVAQRGATTEAGVGQTTRGGDRGDAGAGGGRG